MKRKLIYGLIVWFLLPISVKVHDLKDSIEVSTVSYPNPNMRVYERVKVGEISILHDHDTLQMRRDTTIIEQCSCLGWLPHTLRQIQVQCKDTMWYVSINDWTCRDDGVVLQIDITYVSKHKAWFTDEQLAFFMEWLRKEMR